MGKISAAFGFSGNDNRPGPEIQFLGTHIERIEAGIPGPFGPQRMEAELLAPSIGSLICHGGAELHFPYLEQFDTIRIDGGLEARDPSEDSIIAAETGTIVISDVLGASARLNFVSPTFTGNIVLNARGQTIDGSDMWLSDIIVGTHGPLQNIPHYPETYSVFGGGVGVVRNLEIHGDNCLPPRNYTTTPVFLNSAFCHLSPATPGAYEPVTVRLRARGPIRTDSLSANPFTLERATPGASDYADMLTIDIRRGTGGQPPYSREISFNGQGTIGELESILGEGVYGLTLRRDVNTDGCVIADATWLGTEKHPLNAPPTGQTYDYVFELQSDCNRNGIWDAIDIYNDPSLDQWPIDGKIDSCYDDWCIADVNCDGNVDGFDSQAMEAAVNGDLTNFCAGRNPDFNRDGNLDGFDIQAVEIAVGGGGCPP